MSIHKLVLHAARAGTSKAEVPARADADMAGAAGVPGAGGVPYGRAEAAAGRTARADQTDGRTGDGQVGKKPSRGARSRQKADSRQPTQPEPGSWREPGLCEPGQAGAASRVRCDGKRARRRHQALSWSSGTHRHSRRSNLLYVPFTAMQIDNRHTICHF